MVTNNRRDFIIKLASASAAIAAGGVLSACGGGGSSDLEVRFDYGVASGDPLSDSVILWTHAKGRLRRALRLHRAAMGSCAGRRLATVVASGTVMTTDSSGYTAKVDAKGLTAGQNYYYRFKAGRRSRPWGAPAPCRPAMWPTSNWRYSAAPTTRQVISTPITRRSRPVPDTQFTWVTTSTNTPPTVMHQPTPSSSVGLCCPPPRV
ncbi:MAG: PhoD-like phosphatase N-terminal domain-containing protein [Burkholderiales bacterium]|nr:PhoD-like phosphatase N-terminal domain-containing protein [Burkholderiales bacterium]